MEEEKRRIEGQINRLLNDFNEKYKVEVFQVDVDYCRYLTSGPEFKRVSVKLKIR